MRLKRRGIKLLALFLGLSLVGAACGSDDEGSGNETENEGEAPEGAAGGDLVDIGTFVGDPPEHIDPALNSTLDAYQVINAVYDGLTDIDATDPANPKIVPHVAESVEPNDDASVWTFTIREGQTFSDGEEILPSTFQNSWERAADLAGDYSYLLTFIEGGAERLDEEAPADSISGIEADDEAMTLTVTLAEPYSNFDAVAGFQLFMPVPEAAIEAGEEWENGVMVGNGPYAMESARTPEEIVLVKNDEWNGDYNQETWDDRLDTLTFRVTADPDTSYNSFEAGEGDIGQIPPARVSDAEATYGNTLDVDILGSYHFVINDRDPLIGGDDNLLLRQAVSQAIDREEINEAVYNGSRATTTGITPPGIPGYKEGLCEYCTFDAEAAQASFDEWTAAGNSQSEPLPIQFNADAGHEPVVAIIIDNLAAIGIEAVAEPFPTETYFTQLAEGACTICRAGWFADYPTYDNFMFDLFHSTALDGNNYGFTNDEFDALVDEAKQTVDADEQATLFQDAERILLNDATMAIPINRYRGDYVYNEDTVANFPQTNFGLILWEQVKLAA
ncbi:MAG: ABC transporter substrate-binding protein [Acidimicrobiales bacterium]